MEYAISVLERELNNCLEHVRYYESQGYDTSGILNEVAQLKYAIEVLQGQANV